MRTAPVNTTSTRCPVALTDGLAAQQGGLSYPDSAARLVPEAVAEMFSGRCHRWV